MTPLLSPSLFSKAFSFKRPAICLTAACVLTLSINGVLMAQGPTKKPESAKTPTPSASQMAHVLPPTVAPALAKPELPHIITVRVRQASLATELARSQAELEHGLMDRRDLPDNHAMLFVLPKPEQATFWMKDTLIPLSIAYMDKDGVILEIHDMQPEDTSIVASDSKAVSYALECNQHWFELNGVHAGDKLDCSPNKISDFSPE